VTVTVTNTGARHGSEVDVGAHGWARATGDIELFVGASSGDLRLSTTLQYP